MTDYIINPIWFYLAGISSNLSIALTVIGIIGLIITISFMIVMISLYLDTDWHSEEERNTYLSFFKKAIPFTIIFGILILIAVLLPSEETCYAMMVANIATKTNIEWTVEGLKSIIDYIATTVQMVGG